jgi:transcription elongation factor Elf1
MLETVRIQCPYCGERVSLSVDTTAGDQDMIEDCQVCCQPIALTVRVSDAGVDVSARSGDEA